MTTPHRPRLEGQPPPSTGMRAAGPAVPRTAVGEPNGAARKGVRTALHTNRFRTDEARHGTEDPTPDRAGIRIYAPPVYRHHWDGARWSKRHGDTLTAAYACPCGQTGTATGARAVAAIAVEYEAHKHFCTCTPDPLTERRTAA